MTTPNLPALLSKINAIPMCDDGRKAVKALVEEIVGAKFMNGPKPAAGQVWIDKNDRPVLLLSSNQHADLEGTDAFVPYTDWPEVWSIATFAAHSLAEYIAQGGKL